MRVRLLGGFRISLGSRTVGEDGWRLRKAASLLKLLALAPRRALHREQLTHWLWPELDQKAQANNLRQALFVARKVLEPDASAALDHPRLRDEGPALRLEGAVWVDVEAFEEAAGVARRARDPAAYRAAINLYAGELLPQDRYEPWAENRREMLKQQHLSLLLELAELYAEGDELGLAVGALERVLEQEPAHEEGHVELMRLYALSGRRREAMLQYERLREVLSRELGAEPGDDGRRLYEELRGWQSQQERSRPHGHTPVGTGTPARHNLPAERTSFVGREGEMVEVQRLLAMTRLLTLTGTGGSGKTRFALAAARELAGTYPDGAWFVELAPLSEGDLAPLAVAQAVGVHARPGLSLIAALKDDLCSKRMLLILDNCEHVVEAAADLVETLLDSCPGLRILTTSREALNLAGELVWRVSSLSVPDPDRAPTVEGLVECESVRLFVDRARYRDPAFVLKQENAGAVAEVCKRLDGIPLAIELAAAKVRALSVEQIAARIGGSLELLTGNRTAEPRRKTLTGALDWSYELLSEPERDLFARLSVFWGGWTLEAAEAVATGDGMEEDEVLGLLLSLTDKSLVVVETGDGAEPRYRMLEPVRQYGRGWLEKSGKTEQVQGQHARYYLALAEGAEPGLTGARQVAYLKQLEIEYGNLRAALFWALEPEGAHPEERAELGLKLAAALWPFWSIHGLGEGGEGLRWLQSALERSSARSVARAKALNGSGWITLYQGGDYERAISRLEEGLALFRELGDRSGAAISLAYLGRTMVHRGDEGRVRSLCEEAETLRREPLDGRALAELFSFLGMAAVEDNDYERAVAMFEESLAIFREQGNVRGAVRNVFSLGLVALEYGDTDRAATLLEESMRPMRELKDKMGLAYGLLGMAGLAVLKGQPTRAARLWGAAEALREAFGRTLSPFDRSHFRYEARVAAARSQLDEKAWEAAWTEGRAMTLEMAVEYALSEEESPTTTPKGLPSGKRPSLTRREREVAVLLAQERTNRQIAEELFISERTVSTHVRRILKKLGLRSRVQVAAWAVEQRLLA